MDEHYSIDERLNRYLHAEMTEEEERAFEQEVRENAEVRSQLAETLDIIEAVQREGRRCDLQVVTDAQSRQQRINLPPQVPPTRGSTPSPLSLIITAILIIVGLLVIRTCWSDDRKSDSRIVIPERRVEWQQR